MNKIKDLKIGLNIAGLIRYFGIEDSFKKFKEVGIDCADYPLYVDWNKEDHVFDTDEYVQFFENVKKSADKYQIKINQTHGFFPTEMREREWMIETYKKQIRATNILGAKYIVIHPLITHYEYEYREQVFKDNIDFLTAILPTLKEYNVIACLENLWEYDKTTHYIVRTNISTPNDLIELLERLNDDQFGVCLDFGHMQNVGVNVASAIRELGNRIKVTHIHDNDIFTDSHDLPTFGKANWTEIMKALNDIEYQGVFSMEINIGVRVGKYKKELIVDMIDFARKIAKALLTDVVE